MMQIIYSVIKYEWLKASKVRTTHTLRLCVTNIRKGGWEDQSPFCFSDNAYFTFTLTLWGRRPLPETDKVMLPLFMDERNTTSRRNYNRHYQPRLN